MKPAEARSAALALFEGRAPKRGGVSVAVYRCELVEERRITLAAGRAKTPAECAQVLHAYLGAADREHFLMLMLDGAATILGVQTIAIGTISRVLVTAREVFKPALLRNAERVVIAHNHPDGDPRPSKEDRELTRDLVKAGATLGVPVVDHIILGRGAAFYSFLDDGALR